MRSVRSIWLAGLIGWCLVFGTYAQSQSDEVAPGENLVLQGVPKIPASIAEQVGRYTEYRQANFRSWNPVRREMLVITRFGDTYQVHRVNHPGGARTQLTFFPDNLYMGVQYEPVRGESFIFAKDIGGGEFYQIYRDDLRDGRSRCSPTASRAIRVRCGRTRASAWRTVLRGATGKMLTSGWLIPSIPKTTEC